MAEQLDLTTPVTKPTLATYTLASLHLDWLAARVSVTVVGSDGQGIVVEYTGPTATAMMTALNTANLSVKSLYRRVLEKLVLDGKLPGGTVSGTPQ